MKHEKAARKIAEEIEYWSVRYTGGEPFVRCLTTKLCAFAARIASEARKEERRKKQ